MNKRLDTSRSSNIKSLEYNTENLNLFVEFKNGSVYQYFNVPNEMFTNFELLKESDSFGKYFIANVRNNFDFKKIREGIKIHK